MTAEVFTIREIGGRTVEVTLRNRGLPHKPFTLTGTHRLAQSASLGSPYQTQQATGAQEDETTITGEWSTVWMAEEDGAIRLASAASEVIDGAEVVTIEGGPARTVVEAADAVDDLRKRGALVRVTWAHVVRIGRIGKFEQKWNTPDDLEWSMTFAWIGADEETAVGPPPSADPTTDVREISRRTHDFLDATTYSIENVDPVNLDAIDQRVARIQNATIELGQAIRSRVEGVTSAVESFRRGLSVMAFVAIEAELLALEIETRVAGTWIANVRNPEDLTTLAGGEVLAVLTANRIATRAARALGQDAARRRFDNLATVDGTASIYVIREGEDLHSIAQYHYGSADAWTVLRDFNHFTSASPPIGTVVLAPPRQTQGAGW